MDAPFNYIDGKPINLELQSHRDEVIYRNKTLLKALDAGLELSKISVSLFVDFEFQCVKCGTNITERIYGTYVEITEFDLEVLSQKEKIKCPCCKTTYRYDQFNQNFTVVLPKIINKPVKSK